MGRYHTEEIRISKIINTAGILYLEYYLIKNLGNIKRILIEQLAVKKLKEYLEIKQNDDISNYVVILIWNESGKNKKIWGIQKVGKTNYLSLYFPYDEFPEEELK